MVPLVGYTVGHAGVAIAKSQGWLPWGLAVYEIIKADVASIGLHFVFLARRGADFYIVRTTNRAI